MRPTIHSRAVPCGAVKRWIGRRSFGGFFCFSQWVGFTLSPGTEEYQEAKSCECCAPTPAAAPLGPLVEMRGHGEGGLGCIP